MRRETEGSMEKEKGKERRERAGADEVEYCLSTQEHLASYSLQLQMFPSA